MDRFETSVLIIVIGLAFTGLLFYRQFLSLVFSGQAGMPLNELVPSILMPAMLAISAFLICVAGMSLQGNLGFTLMFGFFIFLTLTPFFAEYIFEIGLAATGLLLSIVSYFLAVISFFLFSNKSNKKREP